MSERPPSESASPPSSSSAATSTATSWPEFVATRRPVAAEDLGPTWRDGCPVGPDGLTLVTLPHVTFEGTVATGELVIATEIADDVIAAFGDLYAARFPVRKMINIASYSGDDNASMADDNTSAFNCRPVTGGSGWSQHAYGLAVDINPLENPYVLGGEVLPPAGADFLDRGDIRPGMIIEGDVVVRAFTSRGFEWGGRWTSSKDYQHVAVPR